MSCTYLPKAAKPVWANQLTRLPCRVVYAKFQFVNSTIQLSNRQDVQHIKMAAAPFRYYCLPLCALDISR